MNLPEITTKEEWLEARRALLADEKAMTKAIDALNTRRRELPMVEVDKDYVFEGPEGTVHLPDLFDGARQLVVQHFMFDPEWDAGCSSCTAASDEISPGLQSHLRNRDTRLVVVARAPLPKIERYRLERGWDFPWYSSYGSDFNYDFHVTLDASVAPVVFNYRTMDELAEHGMAWMADGSSEQPGYSTFVRDGNRIFHTYSVFARGTEMLGGAYAFLDMTALGRQEAWEQPAGRSDAARRPQPDFAV